MAFLSEFDDLWVARCSSRSKRSHHRLERDREDNDWVGPGALGTSGDDGYCIYHQISMVQ